MAVSILLCRPERSENSPRKGFRFLHIISKIGHEIIDNSPFVGGAASGGSFFYKSRVFLKISSTFVGGAASGGSFFFVPDK